MINTLTNILTFLLGVILLIFSFRIGIKENFKFTTFNENQIKNLSTDKFQAFKLGISISILILGVSMIIYSFLEPFKFVFLGILIITCINIIRLGIKYTAFN